MKTQIDAAYEVLSNLLKREDLSDEERDSLIVALNALRFIGGMRDKGGK